MAENEEKTPVTPAPETPAPEAPKDEFDTSDPDFFGPEPTTPAPETPAPTPTPTPTGEDEGMSDEDKKNIAEVTGQAVAPVKKDIDAVKGQISSMQREQEVSSFLNSEEGKIFAPFADKIKKFANDPKLRHIKLSGLAPAIVGTKNLLKLGAKMATEANTEAAAGATPGGSAGASPEGGDKRAQVWQKPKQDFAQMVEDVKAGRIKELK